MECHFLSSRFATATAVVYADVRSNLMTSSLLTGHFKIVKAIVEAGADIEAVENEGYTYVRVTHNTARGVPTCSPTLLRW